MEIISKITKISFKGQKFNNDRLEITKRVSEGFNITTIVDDNENTIILYRSDLMNLSKFINDKLDSMDAFEGD